MDLQELASRLERLQLGEKHEVELTRLASAFGGGGIDDATRKRMLDWAARHGCDLVINEMSGGPAIFTRRTAGPGGA